MELFVVRHAIAEERRDGMDDAERALTERGRERFSGVVEGLGRLDLRFDAVLHSPWRRARETAEMMRSLARGDLVSIEALAAAPEVRLCEAIEMAGEKVAVVGHEPWLSELVAWLVLGNRALGDRFELKKGAIVRLSGEARPGAMRLRALLPPKVLRR